MIDHHLRNFALAGAVVIVLGVGSLAWHALRSAIAAIGRLK